MADIDIDASGEHESRPDEPMGENIPLTPVIPGEGGVPTWEPTCEQEMSFGGEKTKEDLSLTPEEFHFDDFELRGGKLYYKGMKKSLTKIGGDLRTVKELVDILGKKSLNKLSFSIPRGHVTIWQAAMLNKA